MGGSVDIELVAGALAGDLAAWERLIVRHADTVRAVARAFRLQPADVADVEQTTWVRAIERLPALRDPECVGGWLATIARRESLGVVRRAGRDLPDDGLADLAAGVPGPEAALLRTERRAAVARAADGLSGSRRRVVDALFRGPDPAYTDVARATGMPIGSIGPTRGRALAQLRQRLVADGFGPEDAVA